MGQTQCYREPATRTEGRMPEYRGSFCRREVTAYFPVNL